MNLVVNYSSSSLEEEKFEICCACICAENIPLFCVAHTTMCFFYFIFVLSFFCGLKSFSFFYFFAKGW